ncbi:hypothetical protein AltI4_33680 [Alteromonas sp. I4]|nr:hypothetical protein AltI4_33680 [Alteromonas sp. I4]
MVAYYNQSVIPGLPRDLFKKATMHKQPPKPSSRACPGTYSNRSRCTNNPPNRHPGLDPGPTQTGRDLKTPPLDVSKIPNIAGAISGRRMVAYYNQSVIPGLPRDLLKQAAI